MIQAYGSAAHKKEAKARIRIRANRDGRLHARGLGLGWSAVELDEKLNARGDPLPPSRAVLAILSLPPSFLVPRLTPCLESG